MKKLFAIVLIIFVLTASNETYAEGIKIKVISSVDMFQSHLYSDEIQKIDSKLPKITFIGADNTYVKGTLSYTNYDKMTIGSFDLQWIFVPDDDKYETRSGILHLYLWPEDTEEQKGKMPESATEELTASSLTATSVQLSTLTVYDININNKALGSTYNWTSSDTSVAEVGKGGLVKAKKEGSAVITCDITYPDATKSSLSSLVTVGYDDNAPVLAETDIDLSLGDAFDINLENTIAKSKYRWATSNKSIVKVNSANGKVVAVSVGNAYVTCAITAPDKQVIVLRCDISVTE